MDKTEPCLEPAVPAGLRLLDFNELVAPGDFVKDERGGILPWAGPRGFRADSFVLPIYRLRRSRLAKSKNGKMSPLRTPSPDLASPPPSP
jgi:hypothetical protein